MFRFLFSCLVCVYSFLPAKSGYFGTFPVYQESVKRLPVSETSPEIVAMAVAVTELPPPSRARLLQWLRQRPSLVVLAPVLLTRGQGWSSWEDAEKQETQGSLFDVCQPQRLQTSPRKDMAKVNACDCRELVLNLPPGFLLAHLF